MELEADGTQSMASTSVPESDKPSRSVVTQSSARALTGWDRGCRREVFGRLVQVLEQELMTPWAGCADGKKDMPPQLGAPCMEVVGVMTVGVVTVHVFIMSGTGMPAMGMPVGAGGKGGGDAMIGKLGGGTPGGPPKCTGGRSLLCGCRTAMNSSNQSFMAVLRAWRGL